MASDLPPSNSLVAGKYQLLGLIGRGGMGSVWEGRHVSLGTRVAIKFIEKEYAESKEARSRFDNEARAAATIQSKHAIQIFDHGVTDDGKPYIVMELLVGEPLDKRLERMKRLPLQDVARILNQVARGLTRAHDGGIVHRDLKPENIFLVKTPDDDDEIAKVLDFGIAKIRGPGAQALSNSTKTGAVLGTPYYMSPEQARGLREVDHRTDLWSLGVIVFKCVTGVLPFDGESLGDLLVKICTNPLPVPSQVLPGLPPAFDAWFTRALERDPHKRFATAQEMADQLSYAAGISVRRSPHSDGRGNPELGHARTAPSYPPGPFSDSSGTAGTVRAAPGSMPGPHTPAPYAGSGDHRVPNVTAVGLSASASRNIPAQKSSTTMWIVGAVVLVLLGAVGGVAALALRNRQVAAAAAASHPEQVQITPTGDIKVSSPSGVGVEVHLGDKAVAAAPPDTIPPPPVTPPASVATHVTPPPAAAPPATTHKSSSTKPPVVTITNPKPTSTGTKTGTTTKPPAGDLAGF